MSEHPSGYEYLGDPDADRVLTRADHKRQAQAVEIAEYVRELVDKWPPLTPEQASSIRSLLFDVKTPPQDIMRWRVRLYCGHQVERSAHRTHKTISAALSDGPCPICRLDPATIVAAVPLGLVSELVEPQADTSRLGSRADKS